MLQLVAFLKTTKPLNFQMRVILNILSIFFFDIATIVCFACHRCCPLLTQRAVLKISAVFKPQTTITGACHVGVFVHAHLAQRLLSHITRTIVVHIVFYRP